MIEVLIAVMLIAAAALLMFSLFGQGFRLYVAESQSADEQMNLRQVLSDITNRARLTDPDDITCDSGTLTVGSSVYTLDGTNIKRSGVSIASGIASFDATIEDAILEIKLVNVTGKSLSTSFSLLK